MRRTLGRTSEGWKGDSPKSEKLIGSVPLRRALAPESQEHIALHPHGTNPQASLWPRPTTAGTASGAVRSTGTSAGSTTASTVAASDRQQCGSASRTYAFTTCGIPVRACLLALVAAALCHSDTATTYRVHLWFFPDAFPSDIERLDEYIGAADYPQPLLHKPVVVANG